MSKFTFQTGLVILGIISRPMTKICLEILPSFLENYPSVRTKKKKNISLPLFCKFPEIC